MTKEQTKTFKDSITTALLNANLNVSKISFVRRPAQTKRPYVNKLADGTYVAVINLANDTLDVDGVVAGIVDFIDEMMRVDAWVKKLEARMAARRSKT